jgi:hypothetical protein
MAEEHATAAQYAFHVKSYNGFLAFAKYGTVTVAVILILMAIFLL